MTDKWTDAVHMDGHTDINNVAPAHSYHEAKSCSNFGYIPPGGLGGDGRL